MGLPQEHGLEDPVHEELLISEGDAASGNTCSRKLKMQSQRPGQAFGLPGCFRAFWEGGFWGFLKRRGRRSHALEETAIKGHSPGFGFPLISFRFL